MILTPGFSPMCMQILRGECLQLRVCWRMENLHWLATLQATSSCMLVVFLLTSGGGDRTFQGIVLVILYFAFTFLFFLLLFPFSQFCELLLVALSDSERRVTSEQNPFASYLQRIERVTSPMHVFCRLYKVYHLNKILKLSAAASARVAR